MTSGIPKPDEKETFAKRILENEPYVVASCHNPEMYSQLGILPRSDINYKTHRHWWKNRRSS